MRLLVPAAGLGTRLYPLTHSTTKALLPVAGKPMIDRIVALYDEPSVLLVVSPGERTLVEHLRARGVDASACVQDAPLGLGHAVLAAADTLADGPLVIHLSDTLLAEPVPLPPDALLLSPTDDPSSFGIAETEGGIVTDVVEKPSEPRSDLALTGVYAVSSARALFAALREVSRAREGGEIQLTDALRLMMREGWRPRAVVTDSWLDCGSTAGLLDANARFLGGDAVIDVTARVENCTLKNASVGKRARATDCTLSNVIVMEGATLEGCRLENSVVGQGAVVSGVSGSVVLAGDCRVIAS